MRAIILFASCIALIPPAMVPGVASAQDLKDRAGYDIVGVRLSERERRDSRPVRLPDGRVVLRPTNGGIPFLYGFGTARGKPSGLPAINGVTPSVAASTPSGGIVPGQDAR